MSAKQRLTYEEFARVAALGVKLDVTPMPGNQITKLRGRMDHHGDVEAEHLLAGQAVQIHVADFALLRYNEVTNLDDACTDKLQQHLDEGWRILAVCPPNAQRRPDYILGRIKP